MKGRRLFTEIFALVSPYLQVSIREHLRHPCRTSPGDDCRDFGAALATSVDDDEIYDRGR